MWKSALMGLCISAPVAEEPKEESIEFVGRARFLMLYAT
jgi:hypothetical protein